MAKSESPPRIGSRLSRVTTSGRFIPEIDGLRFIAIAAVVLFHLNGYLLAKTGRVLTSPIDEWLNSILSKGSFGVELFFVISGFVVVLPFASHFIANGRRISLPSYFLRRATRLLPPYAINLLLIFTALVLVGESSVGAEPVATTADRIPHLLASLLYQHNVIYDAASTINSVAWSLEIEVQFYLLAPFLSLVFLIREPWLRRSVIVAACILAVAAQLVARPDQARHDLSVLSYIQYFLIGFLLADVYIADWKRKPTTRRIWDLYGVVAWCAMPLVLSMNTPARLLSPPLIFIAYVSAFRGPLSRRVLSTKWLVVLGGMCYTIYLYHFSIISAVGRFTFEFGVGASYWAYFLIQLALVGPVVVGLSVILFVLFERPFMDRDWPTKTILAWRDYVVTPLFRRNPVDSESPDLTVDGSANDRNRDI